MNDNVASGRSTNNASGSDISDNSFTTSAHSTTKSSSLNIPHNETQSCILESGALMCASTGTVPISARPESLTNSQQNSSNTNIPNLLNKSTTKNDKVFFCQSKSNRSFS